MTYNNFNPQVLPRNHFTVAGNQRSTFDMLYRFRSDITRKFGVPEVMTRRGDKYPSDRENNRQLQALLRYMLRDFHMWKLTEVNDNTRDYADEARKILVIKDGVIVKNLLTDYTFHLQNFPLPHFLK